MTKVETLLHQMRTFICQSAFAEAAALATQIESALADLPKDPAALARIQAVAQRNEAVIEAARRGIRAAHRRVDEVRRAAKGSQTYDVQGRRSDVTSGGRLAGRF